MQQLDVAPPLIAPTRREAVDCLFVIRMDEIEFVDAHEPADIDNLDRADPSRRFGSISAPANDWAVDCYRHEGYSGQVSAYPATPTPWNVSRSRRSNRIVNLHSAAARASTARATVLTTGQFERAGAAPQILPTALFRAHYVGPCPGPSESMGQGEVRENTHA